jgi:hypothetical protein
MSEFLRLYQGNITTIPQSQSNLRAPVHWIRLPSIVLKQSSPRVTVNFETPKTVQLTSTFRVDSYILPIFGNITGKDIAVVKPN